MKKIDLSKLAHVTGGAAQQWNNWSGGSQWNGSSQQWNAGTWNKCFGSIHPTRTQKM